MMFDIDDFAKQFVEHLFAMSEMVTLLKKVDENNLLFPHIAHINDEYDDVPVIATVVNCVRSYLFTKSYIPRDNISTQVIITYPVLREILNHVATQTRLTIYFEIQNKQLRGLPKLSPISETVIRVHCNVDTTKIIPKPVPSVSTSDDIVRPNQSLSSVATSENINTPNSTVPDNLNLDIPTIDSQIVGLQSNIFDILHPGIDITCPDPKPGYVPTARPCTENPDLNKNLSSQPKSVSATSASESTEKSDIILYDPNLKKNTSSHPKSVYVPAAGPSTRKPELIANENIRHELSCSSDDTSESDDDDCSINENSSKHKLSANQPAVAPYSPKKSKSDNPEIIDLSIESTDKVSKILGGDNSVRIYIERALKPLYEICTKATAHFAQLHSSYTRFLDQPIESC